MVSQNSCIFPCRIWKIEDIQTVKTVPCSLFPVPCSHRQLIQQALLTLNFATPLLFYCVFQFVSLPVLRVE